MVGIHAIEMQGLLYSYRKVILPKEEISKFNEAPEKWLLIWNCEKNELCGLVVKNFNSVILRENAVCCLASWQTR